MANYSKHISTKANYSKPQGQLVKDRKDQVRNNAGGYVYSVDDFAKLDRFLILGSEGGTYYASERKLTVENAANIVKLLSSENEGKKAIDHAVIVSQSGRAPKNDPAIFVLALGLASSNSEVRKYAAAALPKICRTGTFLFNLVDEVNSLRGWGRGIRNAIAGWYNSMPADKLAFQVCKYASRTKEGSQTWSHKDVLRKAHVKATSPSHNDVLNYVINGWDDDKFKAAKKLAVKNYIFAHESAKRATNSKEIVDLINKFDLARESIPTNYLNDKSVWEAMLPRMPLNAMIRNLGTMTSNGSVAPMSEGASYVINKLGDVDALKNDRIHPINVLSALRVYSNGCGIRGSKTWTPVQSVVDALDSAFYLSFDAIEPTGKRIMVAVDCSGSMDSLISGQHLSARDVAAAISLAITKTEKNSLVTGFSTELQELAISSKMRLDDVINKMRRFNWGGTDCAQPMLYAMRKNLKVDAFIIITDNESWAGGIKPSEALVQYRKSSGISDAKLIVLATTSSSFTIADPKDKNMLDIAGLDSAVPTIINNFISGKI